MNFELNELLSVKLLFASIVILYSRWNLYAKFCEIVTSLKNQIDERISLIKLIELNSHFDMIAEMYKGNFSRITMPDIYTVKYG